MDVLTLTLLGLRGISMLISNPALGGGSSVRMSQASELLDILASLVESGDETYAELKAFTEEIDQMVKFGKEPTPKQWEAMRERRATAHMRLQQVKLRMNATPSPDDDIPPGE